MDKWLRALVTFVEELVLFPVPTWWFLTVYNFSSREFNALFQGTDLHAGKCPYAHN